MALCWLHLARSQGWPSTWHSNSSASAQQTSVYKNRCATESHTSMPLNDSSSSIVPQIHALHAAPVEDVTVTALKEQIRQHTDTIRVLVSEKSDLEQRLSAAQETAREADNACRAQGEEILSLQGKVSELELQRSTAAIDTHALADTNTKLENALRTLQASSTAQTQRLQFRIDELTALLDQTMADKQVEVC